jgi:hypothetical protein
MTQHAHHLSLQIYENQPGGSVGHDKAGMEEDKMLIGIAGKKRSGKDTAAQALEAQLGFRRLSFAGPLKALAGTFLGVDAMVEDFKARTVLASKSGQFVWAAPDYLTGRDVLQRLGQAARVVFGPDFWVRQCMTEVTRLLDAADDAGLEGERIVISDVRYLSELRAIKQAGGYIIRLNRADGWDDGDRHSSEAELPDTSNFYDLIVSSPSAEIGAARVVSWAKERL